MLDPNELQEIAGHHFQRGQVDYSLWALFRPDQSAPPPLFLGRIRKLLDIDRETEVLAGTSMAGVAPHAFHDLGLPGQGIQMQFSAFDTFCLAIGLDLLDLGFKQAEIVFLLRHIRRDLAIKFGEILGDPPAGRMRQEVDSRVYMAVGKVEIVEGTGSPRVQPIILKPEFAKGLEAVSVIVDRLGPSERKLVLLEIGNTAVYLCNHLSQAPLPPKGRPRKR